MPESEHILYEQRGRVATLTLNRPERLNAWNPVMEAELIAALNQTAEDDSVGCLVLTGMGRGFCAGADIGNWAAVHAGETPRPARIPALRTSVAREASPNVPLALAEGKPIIAAINGPAVGIGLSIALACDLRIASERARFSARFVRVGLIPECGSTHNLPEIAGMQAAMELVLTGRIIDASDPLAARLVTRIVPHDELMPAVYALAEEIAQGPMQPVWLAKRALRRNATEQNLRHVVDTETQLFAQVTGGPAHREAVAAFGEKREPRFHDA